MATQIAATPVVKGKEARRILKEVKQAPSNAAKQNARKLINYFENKMK